MSEQKSPLDLDKSGRIEWPEAAVLIAALVIAGAGIFGGPVYFYSIGRLDILEAIVSTIVAGAGAGGAGLAVFRQMRNKKE